MGSVWFGLSHKHDDSFLLLFFPLYPFLPQQGNIIQKKRKNRIHKGDDMSCNVETHTLIVNEIFFKLNVILHPSNVP